MMVRRRSAPSRRIMSTISSGSRSWRPGWIISGAPVSRCACTAARTTFRSLAVHGQVVPISPMKTARIPVSPTPRGTPSTAPPPGSGLPHPPGDLVNDLPREAIHRTAVHVRRMRGRHVVAGAHDDIEPRGARHAREGDGVTGEPAIGGVDARPAAGRAVEEELVTGHLLVEEPE